MVYRLKLLPQADAIVALFPGEWVLTTTVKLPKMRDSEKMRAVPFALEEQLASDPEQIVVALGETNASGLLSVAVVEKNKLESHLQQLKDEGVMVRALVPDFLALTWEAETWTVLWQDQKALVRMGFQSGFSTDTDNLFLLLKLSLEKNADNKPTRIIFFCGSAEMDFSEYKKLNSPIEIRDASKQSAWNQDALSKKPALNLLQGKYRPKTQSTQLRKNWMACAISACAFFCLLFFGDVVQWMYYHHESRVLQHEIKTVYQTIFPNATDVVDPHFRVAQLLRQLQGSSSSNTFLSLMSRGGKILSHFPDLQTQSISFQHHQLQITLQSKTVDAMTQCIQQLHKVGLTISQKMVNTNQHTVLAQITMSDQQ